MRRRIGLSRWQASGVAIMAMVALAVSGCAIKRRTVVTPSERRPALTATPAELVESFNRVARAIESVNAAVELLPTAGSAYSGVIEEYREVRGFILAQRPSSVRVIGQAPVVSTNVFDMVSDGETFRIHIPPKNKFLVGPAKLERSSEKPIENLRPQHLLDAIFWTELRERDVLWEEFDTGTFRYYILTEVRNTAGLQLSRKIWFDRGDLSVARVQVFNGGSRAVSDVSYADWKRVDVTQGALVGLSFPRQINILRPHEDYRLDVRILRLSLNQAISADRFQLAQPAGTELVRLGEKTPEAQP